MKKAGYNEPDDIRSFDHDPRSPYYVEPSAECDKCEIEFDACDQFEHNHVGTFCSEVCHDDYFRCDACKEVECECE